MEGEFTDDLATPDGVSITSLDELRAYLHAQTGLPVGGDDPILLVHVLNQLHLSEVERVHKRHNLALTEALSVAVRGLTADAISKNLQEQIRLADRTHQEFERQYRRARILSVVNLICFAACTLVFAYLVI
ncbi:MAG: hypothetical protein HQL35_09485 [Alphaproteobacteria bacterium]|nr:hypothetical protein [Alphaproteobacteria bacterium]